MTTGVGPGTGPYVTPDPDDTSTDPTILETTLTASHPPLGVDIGGVMAHAEVYNGAIPGPTLRFNAVARSVGRPCLVSRSRNASSASS